MMRHRREAGMRIAIGLATACAALATAGAAQQTSAAGATDWFGRGIVGIRQSGTEVQLELRIEAQGMLLRLVEGEPITIVAVGPFTAGESVVRLPPAPPAERVTFATEHRATITVSTTRQPAPVATGPRAPAREYLLLVLSDHSPDSVVTRRIGTIPGFDPATAAHDLSEYLVGRQSPMWAGYLARR
jgi:hypothetical protein